MYQSKVKDVRSVRANKSNIRDVACVGSNDQNQPISNNCMISFLCFLFSFYKIKRWADKATIHKYDDGWKTRIISCHFPILNGGQIIKQLYRNMGVVGN